MKLIKFRSPKLIIEALKNRSNEIELIVDEGIILSSDRIIAIYPYQEVNLEKLMEDYIIKNEGVDIEIGVGYNSEVIKKALSYMSTLEVVNFITHDKCFPLFVYDYEIMITIAPRIVNDEDRDKWEEYVKGKVNRDD